MIYHSAADQIRQRSADQDEGQELVLALPVGCRLSLAQFLRVATKRASSFSIAARSPKGASAASASATRARRLSFAASMPSRATSVALPRPASLATALPRALASPSA